MDKEPKTAMPLRDAYVFGPAHGLQAEIDDIRDMEIEWDRSYTSSVRRGFIVELFEKHKLFEGFKKTHWPYGDSPAGKTLSLRYLQIKSEYQTFLDEGGTVSGAEDEEETEAKNMKFAFERHLRDFLERNLEVVEKGLKLYKSSSQNGVEFQVDGGRIDLLAIDAKGKFVVIELKLSQGREKTLGQLLYYMAWVDDHLGNGPCRGLIVASEISDALSVAIKRVPGVSLAKYKMDFAIEPI